MRYGRYSRTTRKEIFQSTHPSWGATIKYVYKSFPNANFNPRTHRGVRRHVPFLNHRTRPISIHAPIVGCDTSTISPLGAFSLFQSTHPSWGATRRNKMWKIYQKFQSTHPSWGATQKRALVLQSFNNFNPRTHRGVRPDIHNSCQSNIGNFNPRTHRGVRLEFLVTLNHL